MVYTTPLRGLSELVLIKQLEQRVAHLRIMLMLIQSNSPAIRVAKGYSNNIDGLKLNDDIRIGD